MGFTRVAVSQRFPSLLISSFTSSHRNYGGVYVGFPTDLSNIPQIQIGSLRGNEADAQNNLTCIPTYEKKNQIMIKLQHTQSLDFLLNLQRRACVYVVHIL